ncbi:hypothetical protein RFI36_17455 [Acinetobacter gerneri]|uniref:Extradiol ring-cleavage dioxygenase LigAB LigA subunit domain-containing protein n=1 Tax=Acinetobacter gerneri TaxID=202952 RepID=A0AAW8JNW1_9GAMM|nr:hypothetical protein [Acinetobacter gerneri]MDQ9011487.1 hypothetical protein [Acinetobacter gerneri]MDQ9054075.1 hypothetical protein [Acinetobacter gerneri]MDQ9073240.1 hypothetical protein [Acinetobacter gerneri]MDQ9089247.1 hypothetical protein [Acinetobacter gerneri]
MNQAQLTEQEQKLILDQNWIGLIQHGVNFLYSKNMPVL